MDTQELLGMLKIDLGIRSELYDDRLTDRLTEAQTALTEMGIVLADTTADKDLVVMYAAYLYRKRADDAPVMPRMLRYALNNRLFSQKVSES